MRYLPVFVLIFTVVGSPSALADRLGFSTTLSAAQEVPAVQSTGSARIQIRFDNGLSSLNVDIEVRDLIGNLVGAHLHCGLPGANGPVAFGLINPGDLSFDGRRIRGVLDNGAFTGADCVAAIGRPVSNIAALAFAMREGLIYINLHTDAFPSGEVRGQLGGS